MGREVFVGFSAQTETQFVGFEGRCVCVGGGEYMYTYIYI